MILKSRNTLMQCMVFLLFFIQTLTAQTYNFGERQHLGEIGNVAIDEASGLAASRKNPGVLWTHNDSGDGPRLFAFDSTGGHLGVYSIEGITNRDWEDMAIGPGPIDGEVYLYIGDIGDNSNRYELKYIYRIPEPYINLNQSPVDTFLTGVETITYFYADGNYNAETLMLDPVSKDLYVLTKEMGRTNIYRLAWPQSITDTNAVQHFKTIDLQDGEFNQIVGGDISPEGLEMLIKTYYQVFYWNRGDSSNTWQETLQSDAVTVPYISEPQGEAVCWAADGSGYYTLSEETLGLESQLYFYPRLGPTGIRQTEKVPMDVALKQNYPNPFNPVTCIPFYVEKTSFITLKIYSTAGQWIRTLADTQLPAGEHHVTWDGCDDQGNPAASGVYLYRLENGTLSETRRMLLIR